jgi:hypothetical protein
MHEIRFFLKIKIGNYRKENKWRQSGCPYDDEIEAKIL